MAMPARSCQARNPSYLGRSVARSSDGSVAEKKPGAAALTSGLVQAERWPGWPPAAKYTPRWITPLAVQAASALAPMGDGHAPTVEGGVVTVPVGRRPGAIVEAVRRLDSAGVAVLDVAVRRPTLNDVFLTLTGHAAEESTSEDAR